MKAIAYLVLAVLLQTTVQVDIAPLADSRITVERIAPYSIVLTINSARDITGLAVEWVAGGPADSPISRPRQPQSAPTRRGSVDARSVCRS